MGNPVVHWELMSRQPEKLGEFCAKIFDWKVDHRPEFNYRIVETGGQGGINGGIVKPDTTIPRTTGRKSSRPAARSTSRSRRSPAWASSRSSPIPKAA